MSANEPLVSIIIPCYNHAHFLHEAIESALAQTWTDIEIVVVDDGSTDDTPEVAAKYSRVSYVRQGNRGLSAARNTGLRHSAGDYLIFLDADDRLLPEAAATGLESLLEHPDWAFVAGRHRLMTIDGTAFHESPPLPKDDYYRLLLSHMNFIAMHATVVYRRSVFEHVVGFDESFAAAEDYDLYLRITRDFPVGAHGVLVAEYRQHDANMTRDPGLMLRTSMKAVRAHRRYVRRYPSLFKAYIDGLRKWSDYYGPMLVKDVRAKIRDHDWRNMARGALTMARFYPRGLRQLLSVPRS